jgi:adenylosuccinate lyase
MLFDRYTSKKMSDLWTDETKFRTWRMIWHALAEAQAKVGLSKSDGTPRITEEQLETLERAIPTVSTWRVFGEYEEKYKHDVMAYIHFLGDHFPNIKDIVHLGATSCCVTDNSDLILMYLGMEQIRNLLVGVIDRLATFAQKHAYIPIVGYTHYQPAQFTTIGKRASIWLFDLVLDFQELSQKIDDFALRGLKGATGTQDSYLKLLGDPRKVKQLEKLFVEKLGFYNVYPITGQTYSRKIDAQIANILSQINQSACKFATDVRLMQHDREIMEGFGKDQVGSSAMPYKRNPMKSERLCGIARFVINLANNTDQTACNQWLERTLDDSSNRRLTIPQLFMGTDSVLRLYLNVLNGLYVNQEIIDEHLQAELPHIMTESVIMQVVKNGGDRQEAHKSIRNIAIDAKRDNVRFINLLKIEFPDVKIDDIQNERNYIGLAAEQTLEFIEQYIKPIRAAYPGLLNQTEDIKI